MMAFSDILKHFPHKKFTIMLGNIVSSPDPEFGTAWDDGGKMIFYLLYCNVLSDNQFSKVFSKFN